MDTSGWGGHGESAVKVIFSYVGPMLDPLVLYNQAMVVISHTLEATR